MSHPSKKVWTQEELELEAMKNLWLLNPHIYINPKRKVMIEIKTKNSTYTESLKVESIIGLIIGLLHQLEHEPKINPEEN